MHEHFLILERFACINSEYMYWHWCTGIPMASNITMYTYVHDDYNESGVQIKFVNCAWRHQINKSP